MNRMKKLLPLLIALLLMLTVAMPVQAKNETTDAEVKSGSTYAKVDFTVEKLLAFEGTVSTNEKTGFKVTKITPSYKYEGENNAPILEVDDQQGKIIFIGENIPTDLKLTVELESTSPMKDGTYPVFLSFGRTGTSGAYGNGKLTARIYVGESKPDDDGKKDPSDTDTTDTTTTTTTTTTVVEDPTVLDNAPVEEGTEMESNRVGMLGMLETYELRSALEEAEKLKAAGGFNSSQLAMLQEAIEKGEEALMDDRQSVVDEATHNLWMVIDELGGPVDEREEEKTSNRSGGGLTLPIILAIVAALAAVAAVVAGYLLKKNKKNSYEGAPTVNYEIGDDDEA